MTLELENKEKATQYLFGELVEGERDALEERIFSDEDYSLFLEATENDLVDEYVRDEMDSALQARFEKNYLNSESRREKVRLAAILQKKVFAEKATVAPIVVEAKLSVWESLKGFFQIPNLAWAGGLAAILLGILLVGLLFLRQDDKSKDYAQGNNSNQQIPPPTPQNSPPISPSVEPTVKPDENTNRTVNTNKPENKPTPKTEIKPTPTATPVKKDENVAPPPEPQIFVATLLPPLRSEANPVLKVPASAATVRLRLLDNFGEKYEKFVIELNDNSGNSVWNQTVKTAKTNKSITVNIPNSRFKPGNHEIAVSGVTKDGSVEEISFYNFVVQRK
jgi:hypothetical protein